MTASTASGQKSAAPGLRTAKSSGAIAGPFASAEPSSVNSTTSSASTTAATARMKPSTSQRVWRRAAAWRE